MDIEVVICQDGSIAFFTRSGNFVQGKAAIGNLIAALGEAGVEVDSVSPVEQHRHGPDETVWSFETQHDH